MPGGLPLLQQERAVKSHHGLEAVHDRFRTFIQSVVATDAEQLLNAAAIRTDHIVVQIPGIDTQCFAGVKRLPGIGRTEAGQVKQPFVDNRQRVGHLTTVLLGNRHVVRCFRLDLVRHTDNRSQMAFGRSHREGDDTVHTDRQVVLRDTMRLQECYIKVRVWLHIRSDVELDRSLPVVAHVLSGREDTCSVLNADDRAASLDRGEGNDDLFAWCVCVLVGLEG